MSNTCGRKDALFFSNLQHENIISLSSQERPPFPITIQGPALADDPPSVWILRRDKLPQGSGLVRLWRIIPPTCLGVVRRTKTEAYF